MGGWKQYTMKLSKEDILSLIAASKGVV